MPPQADTLAQLSKTVRALILRSTTRAKSGHPSSSLSSVELMVSLFFGGFFRYDLSQPNFINNDRLILSKGHAAPLLYALWAVAGAYPQEELDSLRQFDSQFEGHPTMNFPLTEAATGSLGQGLSIGVGMALNAKYLDKVSYRTFVLLGDSEMAEGSNWEAMQLASHYKLDNLVGIIDVNRLGQRGETMLGHDVTTYQRRCQAFGWHTVVVDGHDLTAIKAAYLTSFKKRFAKPTMIIAKTMKGRGVSLMENQDNWHGKPLNEDQLTTALGGLGEINWQATSKLALPDENQPTPAAAGKPLKINHDYSKPLSVREAYGHSLVEMAEEFPNLVVLDAEVSNSTFAAEFKKTHPERFFEMFVAEQNMVGVAVGLARRGKIPFVSSFGAFLTRAFDQIRMAQYSGVNMTLVGGHVGVSIGHDGPSQMGLEDIAMFRTLFSGAIVYPGDHISTEKLSVELAKYPGINYLRSTRETLPSLYKPDEKFEIGGSKTLHSSANDHYTVVAAGITLHQALAAYETLKKEKINLRIIDLYSIKPLDSKTLHQAAAETKAIFTVEDHAAAGGLGEAVRSELFDVSIPIYSLAVRQQPRSGHPAQLLGFEKIDTQAIMDAIRGIHYDGK